MKRRISTSTLLENWKKCATWIIPIVIGAFGTVIKRLLKGLEDLADEWRTFERQHYWERPEYQEESWRLKETCCHSNSSERPSAKTQVKNSQRVNNNYNNRQAQTLLRLWYTNGSPNIGPKTRPYNSQQQKKKICKIVDFSVPADHRIKLKECEKRDKYLDLVRQLKKLWNMKVTIIPIVIGAFGTVTKGLLKGWKI